MAKDDLDGEGEEEREREREMKDYRIFSFKEIICSKCLGLRLAVPKILHLVQIALNDSNWLTFK